MRSMRADQLISFLATSLGKSGGQDLMYLWMEEALSIIREKPWAWNWKETQRLTLTPVSQTPATTYTWTVGSEFIISAAVVTIPFTSAGRKVKLGDEWYTCIDFGFANNLQIRVDRPIRSDGSTPVALSFVRWNIAVPTTKIRNVQIDGRKVPRFSPTYFMEHFGWSYPDQLDVGSPVGYRDNESVRVEPPAFAPVVTNSGVAVAGFPAGEIEYFYTRYDTESGLESHPGPSIIYDAPVNLAPRVRYNNPLVPDKAEAQSYSLRLYRSPTGVRRDRKPMHLIQTRDPAVPGVPFDDTFLNMNGRAPYWDGSFAVIELLPPPDSERHSVVISHLNNWSYRVNEQMYIELGTNNQVQELLRIFFTGVINLSGRNAEEYRRAVIQFRTQMNYLITESREAGSMDLGPDNYVSTIPGDASNGDWVDDLSWRT